MKKKSDDKKTSILSSIKVRILTLVFFVAVFAILINMIVLIPVMQNTIQNTTRNYMYDITIAYRDLIEKAAEDLRGSKSEAELKEQTAGILKNVGVEGISSSYAYLVDQEGIMRYHPTAEKIGKMVENSVVLGVVEELKKGNIPSPEVVTYDFKGVQKYAGYAVTDSDHWILVVSADEEEIIRPVVQIEKKAAEVSIFTILLLLLISYFCSMTITSPIKKMTAMIRNIANLNFKEKEEYKRLYKRSDETGEMSRALEHMRENIRNMLKKLNQVSEFMNQSSQELYDLMNEVKENSLTNSATSDELAAGMEETAATTENISQNVIMVDENTGSINQRSLDGTKLSSEIKDRANSLKESTIKASEATLQIYTDIKLKATESIEQSKAVDRIHVLANTIMEISDQTSLLSLNASIEAARAGTAGRGFAVVAGEIGNLADQSAQTVKNITEIVNDVHKSVENIAGCMENTLAFLEKTVLTDYQKFVGVGEQYNTDAERFQESMRTIQKETSALQKVMGEISSSVKEINITMAQSATGVTDIAAKTANVVNKTERTFETVQENIENSTKLRQIVEQFEL